MRILGGAARPGLALLAIFCGAAGAQAGESGAASDTLAYAPASLPTFAQAPSDTPSPSPWAGLSIGSEISVVGGKGIKGGVGGAGYLAYTHEFSNNLIVGVQAQSGYAPSLYPKWSRVNGFDYAGVTATVGYDMGRFEPYMTVGANFAKADFGPPGRYNSSQSLDNLFNKGNGALLTTTTVGAGFNYAITDKVSMGMSFSVTQANGGPATPFLP